MAFAIERARELAIESAWPLDAVVVCSFGDASLNHATAQSALNSAAYLAYGGQPLSSAYATNGAPKCFCSTSAIVPRSLGSPAGSVGTTRVEA